MSSYHHTLTIRTVLLLFGLLSLLFSHLGSSFGQPIIQQINSSTIVYDNTIWPTDSKILSSPFGPRLRASANYTYEFHTGIDIPEPLGSSVYAFADGEVYRVYYVNESGSPYSSGGNVVVIRHKSDRPITFHGQNYTTYYSVYMHLNSILVSKPPANGPYQNVTIGSKIGTVGHSGNTTFNHLHFETRIGTTCSREYQLANPTASCSSFFGTNHYDPHVNPLLFLTYPDLESTKVDILSANPLIVRVNLSRDELDFNQISASFGGKTKVINFNDRTGLDPINLDNPNYNNTVISPMKFNENSSMYQINITFKDLSGFDTITVKDIWGKGLKLTN